MIQGPVYGLTNLSIGKPSNEIRSHYIPDPGTLSNYLFSLFAYKVIDISHKILYTRTVAGDGGGIYPTPDWGGVAFIPPPHGVGGKINK